MRKEEGCCLVGQETILPSRDLHLISQLLQNIRRFDNLAQRNQMEDAYHSSDNWRRGPRERILVLIESYTDIILELDEVTVPGLRKSN